MKAAILARISKEEQSVYSAEAQIELGKQYIQKNGHELFDIYLDEGYSAKNMDRPDLQRMLKDIRDKKFQLVVIWKLDRLTRNTLDGLKMVLEIFKPHGVEFVSLTEDIDTTTPDGFMMFTIRLSMAQAEREKIRERVILGQFARAKKGGRNSSRAPYGYACGEDLKLFVVEDKVPIVKRIFQDYLNGLGKGKICENLEEEGIPAPLGGRIWHHKTIAKILENPAYVGITDWKPEELPEDQRAIVPGTHEPIIDLDVFEKVQDYIKRRRENTMSQSTYDFPFSTIVRCGICGSSYYGRHVNLNNPNRKTSRIYYCLGTQHPKKCEASSITEHILASLIFNTIHFDFHEVDPNKEISEDKRDVEKERKRIERELIKSKEKQLKLAKAMSSGDIDFDIYVQLREEEKQKVEVLEKNLEELPQEQKTDTRRIGEIVEELKNLKRDWNTWSFIEQKVRMQKIFKRITILKSGKSGKTWRIEEIEVNA